MKNSADLVGCYPPGPSASVNNTLLDLQNSSYPTKAEFNNCSLLKTVSLDIMQFKSFHWFGNEVLLII